MVTGFWNNTVDPTPTIGPLYRRQRTFTHTRNKQLVSLGESSRAAKVLELFFSFRTRDRGSLDTPDALEQANFESSRSEKRVRLSEMSVCEKFSRDFGRKKKKKKTIEYLKYLNIDPIDLRCKNSRL